MIVLSLGLDLLKFKMASYFDEHDCDPSGERNRVGGDDLMFLARLLIDGMDLSDFEAEFANLFPGEKQAPPASKKVVESLPQVQVTEEDEEREESCTVCMAQYEAREHVKRLPCGHRYHSDCILPWLKKTNSCPFCRHELPTDDESYEEAKREKELVRQREIRKEELHNSMFG